MFDEKEEMEMVITTQLRTIKAQEETKAELVRGLKDAHDHAEFLNDQVLRLKEYETSYVDMEKECEIWKRVAREVIQELKGM